MGEFNPKRPNGLTLLAISWFIYGLINIYFSLQTIFSDLEVLPYISDPSLNPWFNFGVVAELILSIIVFCLGLIQLVTFPGLLFGKSYTYKLTLAVPLMLLITNVCFAGLYASAPSELGIGEFVGNSIIFALIGMFSFIIVWKYLGEKNVKNFLGIIPSEPIAPFEPINSSETSNIEEEKKVSDKIYYCRYCGGRNKNDAIFCETCGKKLK